MSGPRETRTQKWHSLINDERRIALLLLHGLTFSQLAPAFRQGARETEKLFISCLEELDDITFEHLCMPHALAGFGAIKGICPRCRTPGRSRHATGLTIEAFCRPVGPTQNCLILSLLMNGKTCGSRASCATAHFAETKARSADSSRVFFAMIHAMPALGHAGIFKPMTYDSLEGWSVPPVPNPPLLPPATNGYRRSLYPGRGVSVYCDRHPPNEWPEHWHVQDQISGLLDAVECFVRIKCADGKWTDFHVQGPAVWVIPGCTPHSLIYPKEADMFTLYPEQAFVRETLEAQRSEVEIVPLSLLTSRDEVIGQLSKASSRLCRERGKANPLYVESIGTVLATHILRAMFAPAQREDLVGGLPDGALRRVVRHIDEQLADELCLAVLANTAGYRSTSYFGKLFRKSFGLTPHDYLMRRRVVRAEELLETTQLKAIEIAHMCGFSDDTMMARWFRRVSDRLPSDIRP